MAPLHDPKFQRDIRTIPINGTRNVGVNPYKKNKCLIKRKVGRGKYIYINTYIDHDNRSFDEKETFVIRRS